MKLVTRVNAVIYGKGKPESHDKNTQLRSYLS